MAETIRATGDHLAYAPAILEAGQDLPVLERARIWFLDLDLTPLGEEPDVFDKNSERLRAEYRHTKPGEYERTLLRFFKRLDRAHSIYRSPVLAAVFQTTARKNIRRQLDALCDFGLG